MSLEVDWIAEQPNAGSCDTEMTSYHHREKEFVGQTSPSHQSTGRTYTGPVSAKLIIISITLKQTDGQNMNISIKEIN
jgi:hypothetical protein